MPRSRYFRITRPEMDYNPRYLGAVRVLNARTAHQERRPEETLVYVGRGAARGMESASLGNPFPVAGKGQWTKATAEAVELVRERLRSLGQGWDEVLAQAEQGGGFQHAVAAEIYLHYLRECCAQRNDVYRKVMALAERVAAGESLALVCWCAPKPCHADAIRLAVLGYAERIKRG